MNESERIQKNNDGEGINSGSRLQFTAFTDNPYFCLSKVKEVIFSISLYSEDNWPNDDEWSSILPQWFVKKIKSYSIDEIISSAFLWDYGSWLDAMKYRGWEWFSSKMYSDKFIIILDPYNLPYSVNPLEYVIFESGIERAKIHFHEN